MSYFSRSAFPSPKTKSFKAKHLSLSGEVAKLKWNRRMPKTGIDTKKGIHSHARRFGWETRTKLVAITRRNRGR
jgi:hypothetical protein